MIQKLNEKVQKAVWKAHFAMEDVKNAVISERGDTNFISILIILGIVMVLAGVFIAFKDQIVAQVQKLINENIGKIK